MVQIDKITNTKLKDVSIDTKKEDIYTLEKAFQKGYDSEDDDNNRYTRKRGKKIDSKITLSRMLLNKEYQEVL